MWIVALGWMYVVVMMSIAEAMSSQGSVLGAVFTFLLYGVLPLSVVMYLLATPARRRAARARAAALSGRQGDASSHPPGQPVAPERKEP